MKNYLLFLFTSLSFFIQASDFIVVGYVPTYRWEILDYIDYSKVNHVTACFANPDAAGNLSIEKDIDEFVEKVHAGGAHAAVSICGGGNYSWGEDHNIYKRLLETSESRTQFVHKIMNYLREHHLDGIDNDMEGMALKLNNYNIFTQELADSAHAAGLTINAAYGVGGMWGSNLVTDSTLNKLDYITTMSYGGVGNWNWNQKDDGSAYDKYVSDVNHFIERGLPKEKVIGGIPFYAVEFPQAAQPNYSSYHHTVCEIFGDAKYADQNPFQKDTIYTKDGNVIYLNGFPTIYKKIDYANKVGGGIMIWEVGQDCMDGPISVMDSMWAYMEQHHIGYSSFFDQATQVKYKSNSSSVSIDSKNFNIEKIEILDPKGVVLGMFSKPKFKVDHFQKGEYQIRITNDKKESIVKKLIIK